MRSSQRYAMKLQPEDIGQFQETVWAYYREHGRSMPWRQDPSPFNVLVSELMLQQTQVARVLPKFDAFLYTCDNFADLADLPLSKVLDLWSGLGYNRRAKYLHQTAQIVTHQFDGRLPDSLADLVRLPGVGPNTAGAIAAYAFNQPVAFVETNIRTVFFHHFFPKRHKVDDKELVAIAEQVVDQEHAREWYWALMDYGSYLKQQRGGLLDTSRHYRKQAPLAGSRREMRGRIVRALVGKSQTTMQLKKAVAADERFEIALAGLISEGLVTKHGNRIGLTGSSSGS